MKNKIYQIAILIFLLTSCSVEKKLYRSASRTNTIEVYENYLANYESGIYTSDVLQKIEDVKFANLRDSVFSEFININKDSTILEDLIEINPSNQILAGNLINIQLENLPQNKYITLHAYRRNWNGLIYSFACFRTDSRRQIILNKDKPISATYSGIDSLGIFWSMTKPVYKEEELPFGVKQLKWNKIYFQIEADQKIISKNDLQLIKQTSDIIREKIRGKDLTANFYYPKNKQKMPLIIMLGGSEGRISGDEFAKIISSHGYAVLALGYFGMENLPKSLEKIPLEYFFNAIDWTKEKPFIDTNRIVIAGGSRGGEAALLIASMRNDVKGVIAIEPSNVIWQGIPNGLSVLFSKKSAWTLNGKKLPYLKHSNIFSIVGQFACGKKQIEFLEMHETIFTADKSDIEAATIKVEKINGPILLIAGKDSKLWPSFYMCENIKSRLDSSTLTH